MTTQLPPRRSGDAPRSAAPPSAEPATAPTSAPIPEWVRYFPEFPRLEERLIDDLQRRAS